MLCFTRRAALRLSLSDSQPACCPGVLNSIPNLIVKPLTVQGPGADKLTLKNVLTSGNNSTVVANSPVDGETTISGVTIKDSIAPNSIGGGIRSFANLTVATVTISGRVITPQDLGLTNDLVTLTDLNCVSQTLRTG